MCNLRSQGSKQEVAELSPSWIWANRVSRSGQGCPSPQGRAGRGEPTYWAGSPGPLLAHWSVLGSLPCGHLLSNVPTLLFEVPSLRPQSLSRIHCALCRAWISVKGHWELIKHLLIQTLCQTLGLVCACVCACVCVCVGARMAMGRALPSLSSGASAHSLVCAHSLSRVLFSSPIKKKKKSSFFSGPAQMPPP